MSAGRDGAPTARLDPHRFWLPCDYPDPGVSQADLDALALARRLELPPSWQACMRVQDGGRVRYTGFELNELSNVRPLERRWWGGIASAELVEPEAVLDLGHGPSSTLLWVPPGALVSGATGLIERLDDDQTLAPPTDFDAFFAAQMSVQAQPPFSWAETERLEVLLATDLELVDQRPHHHLDAQPVRQVLARLSRDQLVLFSHVHEGFQSLGAYRERALLPSTLRTTHIQAAYGVHCLELEPVTERVWASRMFDGTWKVDALPGASSSTLFARTREELRRIQRALMPFADDPPFC